MRRNLILIAIVFLLVITSAIIYILFFSNIKVKFVLDKKEKKSLEQKLN